MRIIDWFKSLFKAKVRIATGDKVICIKDLTKSTYYGNGLAFTKGRSYTVINADWESIFIMDNLNYVFVFRHDRVSRPK